MKKFTFKGVLDGFRSSVANQQTRADQEIVETLRSENFQLTKTFRHGFPFQPTAVAFDPVQHLLAIGTKSGSLRILGGPGVDAHLKHEGEGAVIQIQFLTNEGALITATSDDVLHLWNFRQKKPEVVHSLKFQRERITYIFLPFQSKWFYVGTEKGNIHIVNIESFVLSGYIINWNKAIEVSRKTHPGAVVHLSDNPQDPSKLLIGYESGQIVLWDLRTKAAEMRWNAPEPLRSVSWHHEGKQFICSHTDGSLTTWNARQGAKPVSITFPHAKANKDGKLEPCKPIQKVEWKSSRSTGEAYVIFSGGLPHDKAGRTPSISVVHGKTTTVLEMEQNVVDFITLCENPYSNDFQDPYAIVVLLNNDLVAIDLLTPGYPCFENPYPMDLHESPVTCCTYLADCPSDLIPAFYSVGSRTQKKSGFSEREWPIGGGEWIPTSCSYNEIILTGHADGSVKFWDASAGTLQILYKLKSAKVFEKPRAKSGESGSGGCGGGGGGAPEDDPFAIQLISLCPESRKLCVAGASGHVILFKFKKQESTSETHVLEIPISYEPGEETEFSPDYEYPPRPHLGTAGKGDSGEGDSKKSSQESMFPLKVKSGPQKKQPGFQAHIVCLTPWLNGEPPGSITALSINSSYGLMAYGNDAGIVIVDVVQKICLLNMGTPDLYGAADPYQRAPKSPKRTGPPENFPDDRCRSPTDQTPNSNLLEPAVPDVTVVSLSSPACAASQEWNKSSSNNASPQTASPAERQEEGEEPLAFASDHGGAAPALEPPHSETTITSLHSLTTKVTIAKKASQTWKGFSLKKQLNRVKKTPLLPGREKAAAGGCSTPTEESPPARDPDVADEDWTIVENGAHRGNSEKCAEGARTADEAAGGEWEPRADDSRSGRLSRPADLPLFDGDGNGEGRPVRPPRQQGQKKKSGSESRVVFERDGGGKRDARLLSVPNLKHQKQEQHSLRDLRRKQQAGAGQPSFGNLLIRHFNKLDSSFSRSRSSSMSSLENISSEAIQCLAFADSYTKKSDPSTFPTLWIGTSLGSVLTIMIGLPPPGEPRSTQPVVVSPWGTIFRLKGCVLTMSFLDCNGALIPYLYEPWKDENKQENRDKQKTPTKSNRMSPTLMSKEDQCGDRQFVVIVSEKQARVVALPSHNCVYRQQLADADFVVKAEIISLKDNVCLVCYISSGHVTAHSLPSLRPLIDVDFLPLAHLSFQTSKQGILDPMLSIWGQQMFVNEDTDQIAKTFCFSNRGHGLYLCSPSEIQKFTVSAEFCASLNEMVRELFLPVETPEPPKASFFQGLFGGGVRQLDREELFGESSGKPSRSVAKHIPGPSANLEAAGRQVSAVGGEISRAHKLAVERGEKLGELEERTQKMMNEAENFANSAHGLMLKYKDKKCLFRGYGETFTSVVDGLKNIYKNKLLPLEESHYFHEFHSPRLNDADFEAKPIILFVGQYSTGKTTLIKYILQSEFPGMRIGPEPTTDKFIAIMHDQATNVIPGNALVLDPKKPFAPLSKYGNAFLTKFQCSTLDSPVLREVTLIDTPGILSGEKQRVDRGYNFSGVLNWFAERGDRIILLFDAHKLDISDEFRWAIEALKGHDEKIRIVLNKADMVDHQSLMRIYGSLMWSLGKVINTPEVARVYVGSFWERSLKQVINRQLFEDEERDLLRDIQTLPRNSALRKLNDLSKRARLVKVHAHIMHALKEQMPLVFGKGKKKQMLIDDLKSICEELQNDLQIPPGDFPDVKKMQAQLEHFDFQRLRRINSSQLKNLTTLASDIAKLMLMIQEEEGSPSKGTHQLPVKTESLDAGGLPALPTPPSLESVAT